MKRKLTHKSLDELALIMPVLSEDARKYYVGGCKQSCVFNCFDYLDGDRFDSCHYYDKTLENLGIEPDESGYLPVEHITTIGGYGGFHVSPIEGDFVLRSDGTLKDGSNVMLTFENESGGGHAVVAEGYIIKDGKVYIQYKDPTTGKTDIILKENCSDIYRVSSNPPITGNIESSDNSGSSGIISGSIDPDLGNITGIIGN